MARPKYNIGDIVIFDYPTHGATTVGRIQLIMEDPWAIGNRTGIPESWGYMMEGKGDAWIEERKIKLFQ